ncbi:hypothetical protein BJX64DRAFT_247998 [Aspergillus heterothallicus]
MGVRLWRVTSDQCPAPSVSLFIFFFLFHVLVFALNSWTCAESAFGCCLLVEDETSSYACMYAYVPLHRIWCKLTIRKENLSILGDLVPRSP